MSPTTGLPKSSHSFFNKALREALAVKGKNIQDIYHLVLRSKTSVSNKGHSMKSVIPRIAEFIDAGLDQRPHTRGSLADPKITLHDPIMMDDPPGQEDLLNKVFTTYQQAHCKPSGGKEWGEESH
jgi:hypothetical protein